MAASVEGQPVGHQASAYNPNPSSHPSLQKSLGFIFIIYYYYFFKLSVPKEEAAEANHSKKNHQPF